MSLQFGIFSIDSEVDGVEETKLVALMANRKIVGVVGLQFRKRKSACMRQLFVAPAFRRRGIATELVHNCFLLASDGGCETLGLLLAKGNEEGVALYKSLGFYVAYEYDDGSSIWVINLKEPSPLHADGEHYVRLTKG